MRSREARKGLGNIPTVAHVKAAMPLGEALGSGRQRQAEAARAFELRDRKVVGQYTDPGLVAVGFGAPLQCRALSLHHAATAAPELVTWLAQSPHPRSIDVLFTAVHDPSVSVARTMETRNPGRIVLPMRPGSG